MIACLGCFAVFMPPSLPEIWKCPICESYKYVWNAKIYPDSFDKELAPPSRREGQRQRSLGVVIDTTK